MGFRYDLTGTLLDKRYQITGLLGKGGMGHVYDAVHVALEQRMAIKVLHPRFAHEERYRERFIREARSASKIRHRNVVQITDFGETPDGSVYFAMEYLEGRDVGVELRDVKSIPWARARHILRQAVGALGAAHAKDIVHRDFKPGNCFLTVDREDGVVDFVKLLDFGIAKVGSDSQIEAEGKGLTGTGEVFGTAAYMAPEQARGEELDARSDMYSLGIMAYEMLTGRVPFTGVNSIHVITRHLNDAPAPLRSHDPGIPAEVEALVLKTIAKEREQRFASMGELGHALLKIPESAGQMVPRRTLFWGATEEQGRSPKAIESGTIEGTTKSQTPRGAGAGVESTAVVSPPIGAGAGPGGQGLVKKRTLVLSAEASGVAGVPGSGSLPAAGGVAVQQVGASERSGQRPPPLVGGGGGGGSEHSRPPPGSAVGGSASGSHDRLPPPPAVWVGGPSSTGPQGKRGDSSAETRPHSMEGGAKSGGAGRMIAVVGLLVILVGGISVGGTIGFLSLHGGAEDGAVERAESFEIEEDEGGGAESSGGVGAGGNNEVVVAAGSSGAGGEDGVTSEGQGEDVGGEESGTTGAAVVEVLPPGETSGGAEDDEDEEIVLIEDDDGDGVLGEPGDDEVSPSGESKPKRPRYETSGCAKIREEARAAKGARDWKTLLARTKKRSCWSGAEQTVRLRLQVRALLEEGRFGQCIKVGGRSKDTQVQGMVRVCKKKAEG